MNDSKRPLPSWLPLAAGLAIAVLGMVLLWALVIKSDDDAANDGPKVVDVGGLSDAAERAGHPVYWAGERDGARYELGESDAGRVYVRYLTGDAEPGVRSTDFTTVVTYPVANGDAVAALKRAADARPGAELARGKNGATILVNPKTPGSIHIAYPDSKEQIEIYSPSVKESIRLATSGAIQPVP
jgi:hypothetical protein